MLRRLAWLLAIASLLFAAAKIAHAQPALPSADAGAPAPGVELIVIGGRDAGALLDTVRELFASAGRLVEAHAVMTPDQVESIPRGSAAARVQVDLRPPDVVVIVTEGRRQGPKRRTLRRDSSPSVAREGIAQAIQSAVEAQLFADDAVEKTEPAPTRSSTAAIPAPAPAPPVVPAPPPPSTPAQAPVPIILPPPAPPASSPGPLAVDVSAVAGGGWFANTAGPVVTVGGDLAVASRRGLRPALSLSGRSVLPFQGSVDDVTCKTSALALRALASIEFLQASWFSLLAGGGGGADVIWAAPDSAVLVSPELASPTTRVDPIVSALVAAHVKLTAGMALTLTALGDLDVAPSRYVVVQGASADAALAPWRVRPTLLAGLTFTAVGEPAFATAQAAR